MQRTYVLLILILVSLWVILDNFYGSHKYLDKFVAKMWGA